VQDQILEMRAVRLLGFGQVQRQASIAPVYLRRLDETLGAIYSIGRQAHQEVRGFQQVEPAMHGGLRKRHVATEFCLIDELAHAKARRPHETTEIRQRAD